MSYLVLARKWRPQQFDAILGQEHVTRTLTNAVNSGRIAHAFLFTGARGVGKTSAARILAKALCCEQGDGPVARPCGTCNSCVEIADGNATDVFEIDAASNTGVANVREIIDNVRYLPSKARFKIYIIDEVHMLSTGAFNALLKTLEEPPSHVKFILATTDVHKIPVTILSRCQRFDFRRIVLERIATRLSEILTAEDIDHDPSAMSLVARESEGSMRDAQSLLEQVLTFADGRRVDAETVRSSLGVADRGMLGLLVGAITDREPGLVLEQVKEIHDRGLDLKKFGDALIEYVRDLMVARLAREPGRLLDRPADEVAELVERAGRIDAPTLQRLFERISDVVQSVAQSPYPRFALEVGLASLAEAPPRLPVDALVEQLGRIEAGLAGRPVSTPPVARGGAAAPSPFPDRPPVARRASEPPRSRPRPAAGQGGAPPQFRSTPPDRPPETPPRPSGPPGSSSRPGGPPGSPSRPSGPPASSSRPSGPPGSSSRPPTASERRPASGPEEPPPPGDFAAPPSAGAAPAAPPSAESSAARPSAGGAPEASRSTASPSQPPDPSAFAGFVKLVRSRRPTLSGSLAHVRPLEFQAGQVVLACKNAFDVQTLGADATVKWLQDVLTEYLGAPTTLTVRRVEVDDEASAAATLDEMANNARAERRREKARKARTRPAVKALREELGAEVAHVRVFDEG